MNTHVEPGISGAEKLCLVAPRHTGAPLDASELQALTFRVLQGIELIGTLTEAEKLVAASNHEREAFLDGIEFIVSTIADMQCRVLDNLPSSEEA